MPKPSALSNLGTPRRQHEPSPKSKPVVKQTGFGGSCDTRKLEICRLLEISNQYSVYAGEQMERLFGRDSLPMIRLAGVQEKLRELKALVKS